MGIINDKIPDCRVNTTFERSLFKILLQFVNLGIFQLVFINIQYLVVF